MRIDEPAAVEDARVCNGVRDFDTILSDLPRVWLAIEPGLPSCVDQRMRHPRSFGSDFDHLPL